MNWSNYDDVLGQMRLAGLVVESLDVGRMRRVKVDGDREKRGWYSLHELRLDSGDVVLVGSFGVWRGADANTQKIELKRLALSDDQKRALKARIDADRRQADVERKTSAARAAERARRAWAQCDQDGESSYLSRKGVQAHGVRFSGRGNLVIPMCDAGGSLHGLQVIYGQKKNGRDKDFWPAGLAKQGHFFLCGPSPSGGVLLIAEGYATAASLFEATGHPCAVAFDAGNLMPVATALAHHYPRAKILICADDDYLTEGNPGVTKASNAALAVNGAWVAPSFTADREGKKITDFNDLHTIEGLHVVRAQVEARIRQLGWMASAQAVAPAHAQGEGESDPSTEDLRSIETVEELMQRFALVYELPDTVYDDQESKLVPLASLRNACTSRMISRAWMESRDKRLVRVREVGFDPSGKDETIKCNLWGGWPTIPKSGSCETLLELLYHLCSEEHSGQALYEWILKWLAYPIQNPGAKMKTALVFHGAQGTGKNMFFEAVMAIYGEYGRIIDQAAVEDKFNDWASRKLFLIADEVVARMELFHTKNKLKSLITGEWIRINPKNLGAYDERNHVNMVFLSNETQPIVLERDDRRYCVVYTPAKLDMAFYENVRQEINAGGVAALHDYLLNLPLGDFAPWTLPPMTSAKADLIELSLDNTERFWNEWHSRAIPLPLTIARTEDLYDAYRWWCQRNGVGKPAQLSTCVGSWSKRPGAKKVRKRHYHGANHSGTTQSTLIIPVGSTPPDDLAALSEELENMRESLRLWKEQHQGARFSG